MMIKLLKQPPNVTSNICLSGTKGFTRFYVVFFVWQIVKNVPKMAAESPLRGLKPQRWSQR